jgi:signal transduction histidine kinase
MCVALAFRRRAPVASFGVLAFAGLLQFALDIPVQPFDFALLIGLFTVAAYRSRRVAFVAFAVCEVGAVLAVIRWEERPWGAIFAPTILGFVALMLGHSLRMRRDYLIQLEERAARLEFERDQQAQIAAAAERARIARELHDVVAHSLSVMVAQADGASYAIDSDLPRAKSAMLNVAQTGRDALAEMRRLLGVLRTSDSASGIAPQPGVEQLGELVDSVRRAGLPVELHLAGDPRPLPRGMELTAYRIVQEALTNTLKHGGAHSHAWVTIEYGGEAVELRIEDDGTGAPEPRQSDPGAGLAGMRERAALYGGRVVAGSRPGGGFRVIAQLPLPQS